MSSTSKNIPLTWAEHIEGYLLDEVSTGRPETTIRLRRGHLSHMARCLTNPPERVTTKQLTAWFGVQEWARETRRSYRATTRSFFGYLHRTGVIESDPAADLPKIRMASPKPRPAPDHAWNVANAAADARVTLMLRLAGEAGLRRAEVAKVHVRDLLDGPRLLVHGKGAKERIIPISEDLANRIGQGAAGHSPEWGANGWLFPSIDGGHLTPEYVGDLVARVLPEGFTMHTLRHRFATRAYRSTHDIRAVQILLGHESVATTQRYLAVSDDELRATMLGAVA